MTEPNAALAYQVLDKARAHEQHFSMGTWGWSETKPDVGLDDLTGNECGTRACLAGWTVALAGYRVDASAQVFDRSGNVLDVNVAELAAEMLGITDQERDWLFFAHDDSIEETVAEIFGPRPDGGEGPAGQAVTP